MAYPQAFFQRDAKTGQIVGSFMEVPIHADGTPTRIPVIPSGTFYLQVSDAEDPSGWKISPVEIKPEWLSEIVANYEDGFGGSSGVPIAELADHTLNPAGAFGFLKGLGIEDDGCLWADFHPTDLGIAAAKSGSLPYTSPRFTVGELPDPVWNKRNILIGGALTATPQLTGQGAMVLASATPPKPNTQAASAAASHEGVSDMTPDEIQVMIAEAIAAAKTEWETAQAELLAEKDGTITELTGQLEGLQAVAGDAEAVKAELAMLKAQGEADAAARALEAAKVEFSAIRETKLTVLPDNTTQEDTLELTPEAVQVAASAKCDPMQAPAMFDLMAKNGGKLPMQIATDAPPKPNVQAVSASAGGGVLPGSVSVDINPAYSAEAKVFVKAQMAAGKGESEAFEAFCASKYLPA